jgi:Ca-activated chloride channel family protein
MSDVPVLAVEFLAPGRLWWLLAVVALGAGYVATQLWGRRATLRFTQVDLLDRVAPSRPGWRRHVTAALMLLGLAAGVVAVARPVSVRTERTESEGRILLLFDVSLSMMATDVEPTRLDAAKDAAREFIDRVDEGVEIGLISFAGSVAVEVTPTLDRERVVEAIDDLELSESTAIGDALSTGANLLERLADEGDGDEDLAPGAIVLLSDGETTVGRDTLIGAQEAADAGVPVFTIAFGTDSGVIRDPITGERLPVPVRPEPLARVAETTGGAAYEAATGDELADAYDLIRDHLGETLGEEIEIVAEQTWKWAAAALVLIAAAWALAMWWLRGMV